MESSNPAFNDKVVKRIAESEKSAAKMTINGTVSKTAFLLALLLFAGGASWNLTHTDPSLAGGITLAGAVVSFIIALVVIFSKPSPILITLYALAQGFVLGSFSYLFNAEWRGIVVQAILLTVSIFVAMLILYATRAIKVTEKVKAGIVLATFGVLIFLLISWIISLFWPTTFIDFNSGTTGGIIWAIIVFIASLNLLLDFSFIEEGAEKRLPKAMEWYGAFGLMVTLIWLYVSVLRLLASDR